QAEAIDGVRSGEDVLIVTPTASGKSLVYLVPTLEMALARPGSRALYLFPYKALAQDQLQGIEELAGAAARHGGRVPDPDGLPGTGRPVSAAIYDGDTPDARRRRIKAEPPDIGIANPGGLGEALTGRRFKVVDRNGAPRAARTLMFVNPRSSPYTAATQLFAWSLDAGYRAIVFTKARKVTELLHSWLLQTSSRYGRRVSAYRSGYLPEERRDIERRLFDGSLQGVISTSALELVVDIGGLDVCILVGYP